MITLIIQDRKKFLLKEAKAFRKKIQTSFRISPMIIDKTIGLDWFWSFPATSTAKRENRIARKWEAFLKSAGYRPVLKKCA